MAALRVAGAPLKALNTFGIDASARVLWRVDARGDVGALVEALRDEPGGDPLVLGGGSNLLLTGDLERPVVQVAIRGRRIVSDDGRTVLVEAGAGEPWDPLVRWSLEQRAWGLENLALIPGTAGAAPIQNIGAYGQEVAEVLDVVEVLDRESGRAEHLPAAACGFGYRESAF